MQEVRFSQNQIYCFYTGCDSLEDAQTICLVDFPVEAVVNEVEMRCVDWLSIGVEHAFMDIAWICLDKDGRFAESFPPHEFVEVSFVLVDK